MKKMIALILSILFFIYFSFTLTLYRFNHYEMSETELFLHIPNALFFIK